MAIWGGHAGPLAENHVPPTLLRRAATAPLAEIRVPPTLLRRTATTPLADARGPIYTLLRGARNSGASSASIRVHNIK